MKTDAQTLNIDTIQSSGHTSTITRNLAFPLRTAVRVFCEGSPTDSPPRLLPRGDFHQMATFAYADDAEDQEFLHAQNDTDSVSDDGEEEERSKGVKLVAQFMVMLQRLQAIVRGIVLIRDDQVLEDRITL